MQSLQTQFPNFIGTEAEPPRVARYAVNEAMIRNWVEAHDDRNSIYVDAEAARSTGRRDVVCPPAMISTWVMAGYRRYRQVQQLRADGVSETSPIHDCWRCWTRPDTPPLSRPTSSRSIARS